MKFYVQVEIETFGTFNDDWSPTTLLNELTMADAVVFETQDSIKKWAFDCAVTRVSRFPF